MKATKKVFSILLCAILACAMFSACGGGQNSPAGGSQPASTAASGSEAASGAPAAPAGDLSFSYMLSGQYLNWLRDLNYWPNMQSESGVTIELVNGGDGNDAYYKNVDLMVGSGDLADAAIVTQSQCFVYGAQGAFKDLRPLIEQYAPNVKAFIDNNPNYARMITASNGAIYGLGIENPLHTTLTFYRADHFEKAGITTLPTNIAEFTETMRTLKAAFGSTSGYYPWVGREGYLHFAECFDAMDYIDDSGKVHGVYNNSSGDGNGYDIYSDGFREMIEWYKLLYAEGLIDPEWVSGTGTEEEWQTKYLTGKGSICDDFFSRPTWFMNNGGPENDPAYDVQVMDLFKTQSGATPSRYQSYINTRRYMVIPETSKNEVAVLTFLNWLYSDEGQKMMHYGIEGVNTEKQSDGTYKWLSSFSVEAVRPVGEENFGIYQDRLTFPYPVDNASYYESLDEKVQSYCIDYFNKYSDYAKQIIYSEEQSQQRSNLMAKYSVEFTSAVLKFVNGTTEINDSTWAAFLESMEKAGYSEIHAIDQAACDAMK